MISSKVEADRINYIQKRNESKKIVKEAKQK